MVKRRKKTVLNAVAVGIIKSDKFARKIFNIKPNKKSPFFIRKGIVFKKVKR